MFSYFEADHVIINDAHLKPFAGVHCDTRKTFPSRVKCVFGDLNSHQAFTALVL